MSRWKVFSRRLLEAAQPEHDIYEFENIPEKVRWRVLYAFRDTLVGRPKADEREISLLTAARELLVREYGVRDLVGEHYPDEDMLRFMFEADTEKYLDSVETLNLMLLLHVDKWLTQEQWDGWRDRANMVFQEERVGYQIQKETIVRVDSQFAHREMVKPALGLLSEQGFEAAVKEFSAAHEAYRHGDFGKAVTSATQAFESTMKCALSRLGKPLPKLETAGPLIEACLSCGLLPEWSESAPKQLVDTFKSGLPNLRNTLPVAHGAGDNELTVERSAALLALHLSAAHIIFLSQRLKELRS